VHGASPQRAAFLRQQLEALQLAVTTLAISREPWLSDIEQGVQLAREKGIRAVVSLGGGAVIDAGKAIAALVPAAGPVIDYLEVVGTGRQLEASPLPFVAIPTTAGTGAEVTKNAVINVPEQQRKVSLRDDRMLPDLAIVDPALTDNAPRSITLSSGLDALTQVIEPWLCSRATPFTDALCQQAIPRGIRALKILMEQECPASRDEMAWVSLCGGLALANAGLGVIHGLAGPLGGLSRASHGALCGSLLPFGLALNESQITTRPAPALQRRSPLAGRRAGRPCGSGLGQSAGMEPSRRPWHPARPRRSARCAGTGGAGRQHLLIDEGQSGQPERRTAAGDAGGGVGVSAPG
jgi:alcohol dehydrogenase class IV